MVSFEYPEKLRKKTAPFMGLHFRNITRKKNLVGCILSGAIVFFLFMTIHQQYETAFEVHFHSKSLNHHATTSNFKASRLEILQSNNKESGFQGSTDIGNPARKIDNETVRYAYATLLSSRDFLQGGIYIYIYEVLTFWDTDIVMFSLPIDKN